MSELETLWENAGELLFDETSKFVFMSDCHRGDASAADNFMKNKNIYMTALQYYDKNEYHYVELGDGDELWENREMAEITEAHGDVFELLAKLHKNKRYHVLYGNHDMVKKRKLWMHKNMRAATNSIAQKRKLLFPGLKVQESIVLRHQKFGWKILLIHGHQVDFLNDEMWVVSRFLVRYVWRPLESLGVSDPSSPSKDRRKKLRVEARLASWAQEKKQILVAGHTHRAVFARPQSSLYFNDGSCVATMGITAIEIENNCITLVQWLVKSRADRVLYVTREVKEGPVPLGAYYKEGERDADAIRRGQENN